MAKPSRLFVKDVPGAGKQIHGLFDQEFDCVETRKLKGPHMIATEPWIQFAPKEWSDGIEDLFTEMVEAWNEKHSSLSEQEMEDKIQEFFDAI